MSRLGRIFENSKILYYLFIYKCETIIRLMCNEHASMVWGYFMDVLNKLSVASDEMKRILELRYEPVAITLIKEGEALPSDYTVPETSIRHCGAIMKARTGEKLLIPTFKQACPVGASALGMVPTPPKVASGEFQHNMGMYKTPEAAKHTIDTRPFLPEGSIKAVALAPLSKATLVPDVIVVTALPEQAFWLLPATATFENGGRVTVDMGAVQATCADSTVIPYKFGRLSISLGCFGCRKTSGIAADEMLVGIPFKMFDQTMEALRALGANAIPKSRAKV